MPKKMSVVSIASPRLSSRTSPRHNPNMACGEPSDQNHSDDSLTDGGSTPAATTLSHRPTGPANGAPEDRLRPVPMADIDPGLRACEEIVLSKKRHSGAAPTGPRCARPEDRLRAEPGTQGHLNFQYVRRPVFMGSGLEVSARAPE
jgi:hypothetical protein